jgi:DNA polymerase-3 subunit alpha
VKGCAKVNNIPAPKANAIFDLLEKFAGYGFNKSHAAAYAIVAYQTAYLKANYPVGISLRADDQRHGQH